MYKLKHTAIIVCCIISILITIAKSERESAADCYKTKNCNDKCPSMFSCESDEKWCKKWADQKEGHIYKCNPDATLIAIVIVVCVLLLLCCVGGICCCVCGAGFGLFNCMKGGSANQPQH